MSDLARAAALLADTFGDQINLDYRPGKAALRDALVEAYGLGESAADALVDELERTKHIRFDRSEELGDVWTLRTGAG